MADEEWETLRIMFIGPAYSGAKTSLIRRFMYDAFEDLLSETVDPCRYAKIIEVDGNTVMLDIVGLCSL